MINKVNNNKSFKIVNTNTHSIENKGQKLLYKGRILIPEDNVKEKEYNNRTINGKIPQNANQNNYIDTINNINNMYQSYYEYANKITPNQNKIKYFNIIKKIKKISPNISQRNVNVLRVENENNNHINKLILRSNNSVCNDIIDFKAKKIVKKISENKTKKNQNNIYIRNKTINNNIPQDTQVKNNYSISPNKAFINNQLLTNSQINYQFPVYINNNNNNIYNTQYLNTADNLPITQNINQINKKYITLAPSQIQTYLNIGQGVQYINNRSNIYNNYENMRYTFEPNDNIY